MHEKYSIAAVGYAYGPCGLIKKLIAEAEAHMYKDKTAFKIPLEKLEERVY